MTMLLGLLTWSSCDDEKSIRFNALPEAAKSFIELYFPAQSVIYAEREKEDSGKEYKVLLSDSTEIYFDENGAWESVDCHYGVLPDGLLLSAIKVHIAENYPDTVAYKIERELGGYEITLSNGLKLIYSSNGTFVREESIMH